MTLVQDHDHRSGRNRSRICRSCNRKLADRDSFVPQAQREKWERAHRRLVLYLDWWKAHPSSEGYTGAGWVNGVLVKSRARAFLRAKIRASWGRGYRPNENPPPLREEELDRMVEAHLPKELTPGVPGVSYPVVEQVAHPKTVIPADQKARVRALIAAGETYTSVGRKENLARSTIWGIVHTRAVA
jgi:hypothetical protein